MKVGIQKSMTRTINQGDLVERTRRRARPRDAHGSCRGVTVMEVIIAAFLLTVGLTATAQLVMMATGQVALSKQQSDAASLASQTVEEYRDINFNTLAAGTHTSNSTIGATTYSVQTVVTVNDPTTGMKRVAVTITWGGGQSYATSTILSPLQ
jgi:Tfp pilus assembly protein PilV